MPFKSKAEMRWMYANKPAMAAQWSAETPDIASLPNKVGSQSVKPKTRSDGSKFIKLPRKGR